jgi:integrase
MGKRRLVPKARDDEKPFQIEEAIDAWLLSCKQRGLSPGTIKRSYPQATRGILMPWCRANGIATIDQLDRATLGRLAGDLNDRKLSKWSVAHYLRTINQFVGWLGVKSEDKPQVPSKPKLSRAILSRKEMRDLESAVQNVRDQLMIRILCETGCREGELVNLRVQDVITHEQKGFLHFRGKTGQRRMPTSPELHHRLKLYIARQRAAVASDRLFLSRRRDRRTRQFEPLTENGVYQVVKDAADTAEFSRNVYPHLLRASALTHMQTGPRPVHPTLLSKMTGVSLQVLVQHYSHPTDQALHDAMMANLAEPDPDV